MRKTKHLGVIALAAAVATIQPPAVPAQATFEGVVIFETYVRGKANPETVYVKGRRWRADGWEGAGTRDGTVIADDHGVLTLLIPSEKVYTRLASPDDRRAAAKRVPVAKVDGSETVAGFPCEYYNIPLAARDKPRQVCVTTALGTVSFTPDARLGAGAAALANGGISNDQFPNGFFALKGLDENGKVGYVVTSVERRSLSDAMFVPPAGWTEVNMSGAGRPRR